MKKITLICLSLLIILSSLVLPAAALNVYDAASEDDCKSGNASLNIYYSKTAPTLDGVVRDGEYHEIPLSDVYDYYSYYIGTDVAGTQDDLYAYLLEYVANDMKVYGCWDGTYFYFALVAKAEVGTYTCPAQADSVYMYRYWCTQLGFAAPDAEGTDRFEIGLGASSDEIGDSYCYGAWGTRQFSDFTEGENYACLWDAAHETVTYEVKVSIREVTGETPVEGSQMRFLYLLAQSGQGSANGFDRIQIQCSYGCADEKRADWYVMLNFKGLPNDVTAADEEDTAPAEPELEGFKGKTEFTKPSSVDLLTVATECRPEFVTEEDGTSFLRVTAYGDDPVFGGKKIPVGLHAEECPYLAIRYRTSSQKAKLLGLSYTSNNEGNSESGYLVLNEQDLISDGEWHTVVYYMDGQVNWSNFIMNMCLWPFADAKGIENEVIDIMWIRYYDVEHDFGEATAATDPETQTAAVEPVTQAATQSVTEAPTAPETVTEAQEPASGCSSVMLFSALLLLIPAAFVVSKRKH